MPQEFESLELQAVEFTPVPELQCSALYGIARSIDLRRRFDWPSYGAYVIRADAEYATNAMALEFISALGELATGNPTIDIQGFWAGSGVTLHRDHGEINSATAHMTIPPGCVDVIVVIGTDDFQPARNSKDMQQATQAAQSLFEMSLYPGTKPERVLRTRLNSDDLLIFDHSQPHAFKTVGPKRLSKIVILE